VIHNDQLKSDEAYPTGHRSTRRTGTCGGNLRHGDHSEHPLRPRIVVGVQREAENGRFDHGMSLLLGGKSTPSTRPMMPSMTPTSSKIVPQSIMAFLLFCLCFLQGLQYLTGHLLARAGVGGRADHAEPKAPHLLAERQFVRPGAGLGYSEHSPYKTLLFLGGIC